MNKQKFINEIIKHLDDGNAYRIDRIHEDERVKFMLDEIVPDLPDGITVHSCYTNSLTLYAPFDRKLMSAMPELMKDQGWTIGYVVSEREATRTGRFAPIQNYQKTFWRHGEAFTFYIEITYSDGQEGSTCKRVKIGEETKIVDKFAWLCPESPVEA